jgi:hypothetical protein
MALVLSGARGFHLEGLADPAENFLTFRHDLLFFKSKSQIQIMPQKRVRQEFQRGLELETLIPVPSTIP